VNGASLHREPDGFACDSDNVSDGHDSHNDPFEMAQKWSELRSPIWEASFCNFSVHSMLMTGSSPSTDSAQSNRTIFQEE
jgi:hypothetical protein